MPLNYGTSGIKQKDYQVYIGLNAGAAAAAVTTYLAGRNKTNANALLLQLTQLGELRADSISVTAENGDTVEGNNVGEIVLNKACAMAAELINATPENINGLENMDGSAVIVVVIEKDTHGTPASKTLILINNIIMSYSENITGGDIPRASVNLAKNTATVSDFRKIDDINWT